MDQTFKHQATSQCLAPVAQTLGFVPVGSSPHLDLAPPYRVIRNPHYDRFQRHCYFHDRPKPCRRSPLLTIGGLVFFVLVLFFHPRVVDG